MIIHKAKPLAGGCNYRVVGDSTAPVNPRENTIWINTDMAIGEHQFGHEQPTTRVDGDELQIGDLWFETDVNKAQVSFNAIKRNELLVYPYKAYQWNGSEWKSKNAQLYVNNEMREICKETLVIVESSAWQSGYTYTTQQSNWLSLIDGTTVNQRRPDQVSAGYAVTSTYILLPTSQYQTLTMTYSSSAHGSSGGICGGGVAALRTNLVSVPNKSDAMSTLIAGALYYCGTTWGGSISSYTVTWDISNITTDCYLEIGCMQYGWGDLYAKGASFTIESLSLL